MATKRNGSLSKYLLLHNGNKLKKGYHNSNVEIWSAGSTVTYMVDTDVSYTEEVDYGASCLAPTTFTPTKDGWTFVGWREDATASGDVLTDKTMESEPITLYAVFAQTVYVNYYNGVDRTTPSVQDSSNKYYNNGNTVNATFTARTINNYTNGTTVWSARGWVAEDTPNAIVEYTSGQTISISSDISLYVTWSRTITLTYISNGNTASQSGTAYLIAGGKSVYPTFTIETPTLSGATFQGWSVTEGDSTVTYSSISALQLTDSKTIYAVFKYDDLSQTITVTRSSKPSLTLPSSKYSAIKLVGVSVSYEAAEYGGGAGYIYYDGTQVMATPNTEGRNDEYTSTTLTYWTNGGTVNVTPSSTGALTTDLTDRCTQFIFTVTATGRTVVG